LYLSFLLPSILLPPAPCLSLPLVATLFLYTSLSHSSSSCLLFFPPALYHCPSAAYLFFIMSATFLSQASLPFVPSTAYPSFLLLYRLIFLFFCYLSLFPPLHLSPLIYFFWQYNYSMCPAPP
jgi:hypothetical protein